MSKRKNTLKIALAQMAPVWLNKMATLDKMKYYVAKAGSKKCDLIVFGESLLPGYPYWLSLTKGSQFESNMQKEIHAHYIENAVHVEKGELNDFCFLAKENKIAMYIGFIERAENRGGHSLYCSLAYISNKGKIESIHRKLQPTYEERLAWSPGDGNGLKVHALKQFSIGGLNCWENWMPLPRTALYGMGENLHVAVWPGSKRNTKNITRFIAKESRSFVVSVSGLMRRSHINADIPYFKEIRKNAPKIISNGGSCIAGPDGKWVLSPVTDKEGLFIEKLNVTKVYQERQNFDASGHYARPDVTQISLNTERQSIFKEWQDAEDLNKS